MHCKVIIFVVGLVGPLHVFLRAVLNPLPVSIVTDVGCQAVLSLHVFLSLASLSLCKNGWVGSILHCCYLMVGVVDGVRWCEGRYHTNGTNRCISN